MHSASGTRRLCRIAAVMCCAAMLIPAAAIAAGGDADCDAADGMRILHPESASLPVHAQAVWIDDQRLRWPQADANGRFRLYGSRRARLVVETGRRVRGADAALDLRPELGTLSIDIAARIGYLGDGPLLALRAKHRPRLADMLRGQHLLVQEDAQGRVLRATRTQFAAALDARYANAAASSELGARVRAGRTEFALWAPTAQAVAVCLYRGAQTASRESPRLRRDALSGVWRKNIPKDLSTQYYRLLVDVHLPGVGIVRNRVTDPYAASLSANSQRTWIGDLDAAANKPADWDRDSARVLAAPTDLVIYELHLRDFSIGDASVGAAHRGKYLAFTEEHSNGMRHLRELAHAGVSDIHLLPVFDFATVPEQGCVSAPSPEGDDAASMQAVITKLRAKDCYNWGYDPWHYSAPEGSYATDADDGAVRVLEFRRMVQALQRAGLRVGMDVVYNHTSAAGPAPASLLDRIVPGYYQRLDAYGVVETSTCCANTATEHRMMEKLVIDSVLRWARDYRIDSFRFDLMGHQPRALMERLQQSLRDELGRDIPLIGEGWNFGEVADGRRFVQASQLSLNGSGIATFSDRARDALRGGGPADSAERLVRAQGYLNGLFYDRNAFAASTRDDLLRAADLVRVGLAGSLRDYRMRSYDDREQALQQISYGTQPAGYVEQPGEVINYVENHDNLTLFDINVIKLPRASTREDRVRVQMLGMAMTAFSQGIAYFHAGIDTLRSKSLDRNSYDSGDAFNRLDWSYQDNGYANTLPPQADNAAFWPLMGPLLADSSIKPTPADIAWTRDAFRDLLRIRASSSLFRLRSAADVRARLQFLNTGSNQIPTVIVGHLDGNDYPGANFREILYFVNVDKIARLLTLPGERSKAYTLHPVQFADTAVDHRPAIDARYDSDTGTFRVPSRSAVVYVIP